MILFTNKEYKEKSVFYIFNIYMLEADNQSHANQSQIKMEIRLTILHPQVFDTCRTLVKWDTFSPGPHTSGTRAQLLTLYHILTRSPSRFFLRWNITAF